MGRLPPLPRHHEFHHPVAVPPSVQGANRQLVLRHRDSNRELSPGNGVSSTLGLFSAHVMTSQLVSLFYSFSIFMGYSGFFF